MYGEGEGEGGRERERGRKIAREGVSGRLYSRGEHILYRTHNTHTVRAGAFAREEKSERCLYWDKLK